MGDLVLRDFPGPGCPVLFPLELAVIFGLFCTGAVLYLAVPLVFGRGRLPSVLKHDSKMLTATPPPPYLLVYV